MRDPGNAGTVLRTCDAAGVDVVVCCAGTVDPFNPKTVRSSAGSIFHVPLVVVADVSSAIEWFRSAGLTVYGTDADGTDYASVDLGRPSAFVLGNEAAGLSAELLERARRHRWPSRCSGAPNRSTSGSPAPCCASRPGASAAAGHDRAVRPPRDRQLAT